MEFLVRLEDKPDKLGKGAVSKKGDFITYKPDGWSWGTNERKHYGIVQIKCTEAEAATMCESETALMLGKETVITKYRKTKYDIDALPKETLAVWNDQSKDSAIFITQTVEKV